MFNKIKNISPKARYWLTRGILFVLLIFLGIPIYKNMTKHHQLEKKGVYQVLDSDPETFEKTLLTQTKGELEKMKEQIGSLKKSIEDGNRQKIAEAKSQPISEDKDDPLSRKKAEIEARLLQSRRAQEHAARQQIFKPNLAGLTPDDQSLAGGGKKGKNGIRTISFTVKESKDSQKIISLPPSFMDASLLSGVVAPTAEVGDNHPIPMLIRIKDLAILPNEMKEDLKGCFVVAEGKGKLSQERVEARLLNLSCVTKKGDAIIDQAVSGWVVDADGRAGLHGRVVAKFGAHIARVAVAGFVEGFGEALELSSSELSNDYWGNQKQTLKDTDIGTLATAGAGRGIVRAAESLQKFYLKLAEQTLPVIEVGPTKDITIIISEGTELIIKERKKV